jgi:hypothetical protein
MTERSPLGWASVHSGRLPFDCRREIAAALAPLWAAALGRADLLWIASAVSWYKAEP